mmetsp:Transcript_6957/g.11610  ORF Transcript_6957/g.11610 Transcript_6957/m.11610 type:complete len:426 (+) Transcript_6957:85-1362(+)|eukprot:CAMPEP_0174968136 /NCGR_PEP_ID=MMETSP0004_2-20121128/7959_1 /TAXON_ID=420556 /ORGANISM="Ochromonas sp., Strain CCMP1393" /LENGTH=425 /DNA_ID=CAMNT_0016217321 /DNA_START=62 /DNA_END=1339 /DNA_ORIENTATION=+
MLKSVFKKKKAPADPKETSNLAENCQQPQDPHSPGSNGGIQIDRSDGKCHDLNVLISDSSITQSIKNAASTPPARKPSVHEEEDHGKIALTRSDGLNHCIINVFKGLSDANGATFRKAAEEEEQEEEFVPPLQSSSISSVSGKIGSATGQVGRSDRIQVEHAKSMSSIGTLRTKGGLYPSTVRLVHLSDTHNFLSVSGNNLNFLPNGQILVHSGNFTRYGTKKEFEQFNAWLGSVSTIYSYRVVIFGCRDVKEFGNNWDAMRKLLPNATHVLSHSSATILGIRFYGAPWHWGHHKNYQVRAGAPSSTSARFEDIPLGVQVLVTHGAAAGVLDTRNLPGSKELTEAIKRVRPLVHLHGHSKGAHGMVPHFARTPLVVNSALCDPEFKVMYACAHVVKGTQITAAEDSSVIGKGNAHWHFDIDSLVG